MGMHWNKELLHHSYQHIIEPGAEPKQPSTKVCVDCRQDLPLKKYHAFMSHGELYYRRECNKCNYQKYKRWKLVCMKCGKNVNNFSLKE